MIIIRGDYQTEIQDKKKTDLIPNIEGEPAHKHNANALQPAIDITRERKSCPGELTCGTRYGGEWNVMEAAAQGVEVIASLKGLAPSHEISFSDFEGDEKTNFVTR